ncbi:Protein of unknown function [Micromonospora lupini str. Lupac 08]|uniref:Uncharacterized protein n=1 Tax=Micromonospora lupini str. Lupac 08 TaxID=1150864 RepID=I0LD51_9ACTN|nr:Protein of unknown function [Micromonospora lupini str. Lupac 08]
MAGVSGGGRVRRAVARGRRSTAPRPSAAEPARRCGLAGAACDQPPPARRVPGGAPRGTRRAGRPRLAPMISQRRPATLGHLAFLETALSVGHRHPAFKEPESIKPRPTQAKPTAPARATARARPGRPWSTGPPGGVLRAGVRL